MTYTAHDNMPPLPPMPPPNPQPNVGQPKTGAGRYIAVGAIGALLGAGIAVPLTLALSSPAGEDAAEPTATAVASDNRFEQALNSCSVSEGMTIGDGGRTLIIDNKGSDDYTGASTEELGCVLRSLGITDSALNNLSMTRALDGRQIERWDDLEFTYSYHPDTGLDGSITIVN